MSNGNKKQTVGDLITNTYFEQSKETLKRFSEQREKVLDTIRPTIERMAEISRSFIIPETNNYIMEKYEPTDVLILRELRELNKKQNQSKISSDTDILLTYDTADRSLNRNIGGKIFSYNLSEDGKRRNLLDIVYRKKVYVQTDELRNLLNCPTNQAVAKIVQTFNEKVASSLRVKKTKMIQGKKGSGYRLNPKIVMERENS
jgi:ribonuclease D